MARKHYPLGIAAGGVFAHPERQPESVRSYVGNNWDSTSRSMGVKEYGGVHRDVIAPDPRHHRMTAAEGKLRSGFEKARGRALGGSKVNKAVKAARRLGRNVSAGQVRRSIKNNHVVKFGVDPYHK